jgi:hypothetical protein
MEESNALRSDLRATEKDHRFPSGPWTGFWMQRGYGKNKMALHLCFREGLVSGAGGDAVGRFAMRGTYDLATGNCQLIKQYERAHRIEYTGASEGDELWLWGVWQFSGDRGGFHIWPEGVADPTQRRLRAANDLPRQIARPISLMPVCV